MQKEQLIESLKREGFSSEILRAFEKVKREDFIPSELRDEAYVDAPLPLEKGATISQPFTIAFMLNLLELKKGLKILEIGSGCGYVLALLAEIIEISDDSVMLPSEISNGSFPEKPDTIREKIHNQK